MRAPSPFPSRSASRSPTASPALERRTPAILELLLRPLDGSLEYVPGQYVLLEDRDDTVAPRSYSIANAPRPDGALSLLVTRVPGGQAQHVGPRAPARG